MDKRAIELIQESNDRKLKFVETLYIVKQPRVVGVVVGFMVVLMVSWMYRGVISKSDGFKKLGTIAQDMEKYGLLKFQWVMLKRLGQQIKEATIKWIMKYWRK